MTDDYSGIQYTASDGVATLTLNRPRILNAMDVEMVAEVIDALGRIDRDLAVRVAIVTGEGRAFCAGIQLDPAGLTTALPSLSGEDFQDLGGQIALAAFACRKPLIAAVNGPAVGLGATMTLAMDYRLASDLARFAFVFTRRGLVPEGASTWFLPRLVGVATALDWMISGRTILADEAQRLGLVQAVHASDELLSAAQTLARDIATGTSPLAVAATRKMLWQMASAAHPQAAFELESRMGAIFGPSADASEGVQAFFDKRAPVFTSTVDSLDQLPW